MVWGAISWHGTSRLHIVDGTMNQDKYIKVLETRLLPQTREWFREMPWIFQQDSAPCHTAKRVRHGADKTVFVCYHGLETHQI